MNIDELRKITKEAKKNKRIDIGYDLFLTEFLLPKAKMGRNKVVITNLNPKYEKLLEQEGFKVSHYEQKGYIEKYKWGKIDEYWEIEW